MLGSSLSLVIFFVTLQIAFPSLSMTVATVYLTQEEQELLQKQPKGVQDLFKGRMKPEILTSYETEDELVERMSKANYDRYPEVKQIVEKFGKSGSVEDVALDTLSDGALDVLLFSIGACGICAILETSLQQSDIDIDADAVDAFAALTAARQRILKVNAGGK